MLTIIIPTKRFILPAKPFVIHAKPFVIPAKEGIHHSNRKYLKKNENNEKTMCVQFDPIKLPSPWP